MKRLDPRRRRGHCARYLLGTLSALYAVGLWYSLASIQAETRSINTALTSFLDQFIARGFNEHSNDRSGGGEHLAAATPRLVNVTTTTRTTTTTTTDNIPDEEEEEDLRPRNLRLAFLGDSVSRYQYLQLVYWLKTGVWDDNDGENSLHFSHKHHTWNHFLKHSNDALRPQEQCDCFRPLKSVGMEYKRHVENRYYHDARGNYITFINKMGYHTSHGHWPAESIYEYDHGPVNISLGLLNYTWQYSTWHEVIRHHIGRLKPKPDYLILNAGLHPHDLRKPGVPEKIQAALRDVHMTGIYKTTTYPRNTTRSDNFTKGAHDWELCHLFEHCLDLSWTGEYEGDQHYHDMHHFKSHVNRRMNLQLLEYLGNISA